MRPLVSTLLSVLATAAVATPALAQSPSAPPVAEAPPVKPAFALMDSTGDGSHVDLAVDVLIPDADVDGVLLRPRVLAQYVGAGGLGGYAGLSAAAIGFGRDNLIDHGAVGNLEVGGLLQRAVTPNLDLGARLGLVLPTGPGDDDDNAILGLMATFAARPADLVTAVPEITWLRLGVSPTYHDGPLFLRADVGIDVPVLDADGEDPVAHVNVGAGVGKGAVSATAEVQTAILFDGDDDDDNAVHTAGVSLRYNGVASPYLSVSKPFQEILGNDWFTVSAGVTIPM